MEYKSKEDLLMAVLRALPYSNQIKSLDINGDETAIRFEWRHTKFRVNLMGGVDEIGDGVLMGTNISILLEKLLEIEYFKSN